jgi:hypothetical protein
MIILSYNIKIENEKFGKLVDENFVDATQYKIFLKMIHGCLELKNDLTFFNGIDFLIHIPYTQLSQSIILSKLIFEDNYKLSDHVKSKIEALVTK